MERIRDIINSRASAGFTLVELLVVMSIIGVLIGLLYPAVNAAVTAARVARTQAIIQSLTVGLEAFKADWGVYPPSNNDGASGDKLEGGPTGQGKGNQLMALALMGLDGKGWGVKAADQTGAMDWLLPFGGQARNAYGPYFQQESGAMGYVKDGFPGVTAGFILYYRFDPGGNSGVSGLFGKYEENDNPLGSDKFQDGAGFNDAGHFRLSAMYTAADGASRWQRPDYLLISPGPDRLYGHVYFDPTNPDDVPRAATSAEVGQGKAVYDDVTNFQ